MRTRRLVIIIVVLALMGNLSTSVVQGEENSWRKLGTKSTPEEIAIGGTWTTDLMVDPQNPRHIIATSFWPSIKQSWNGGATWENVNLYEDNANMLTTRIFYVDGLWYFNSGGRIFKTQDWKTFEDVMTGKTSGWNSYGATIPGYGAATSIDDFWTDGTIFYLGMRPGLNGGCLFLSKDSGKTWTSLGPAVLQVVSRTTWVGVRKLFMFKSLLFVDASPWLISSDGGLTFKKVIEYGTDYPFLDVVGDKIWLTWQKKNTIQSSSNGIDWQVINENAPAIVGFSWPSPIRFLYDRKTGMVFASTKKKIVYSRDMGKTWTSYSEGLPTDSLAIWPPDGILCLGGDTLYLSLGEEVYSRPLPSAIQKQTVVILHVGSTAFTVNGINQTLDSPPIIKNGRTLVPIRAIIESLGGTVGWDVTSRKATVILGGNTIELWIDKNVARVNGKNVSIDPANTKVVPEIINSRTMLPLRFVSENLGCSVLWADATQTITITYVPK